MKGEKYLSVTALVMIIFIAVFGFNNIANNFKATGTESTSMFILGALLYFLPMSLIISEFAASECILFFWEHQALKQYLHQW